MVEKKEHPFISQVQNRVSGEKTGEEELHGATKRRRMRLITSLMKPEARWGKNSANKEDLVQVGF